MKNTILNVTKPRAVLFDWDNTLVDTWPLIYECLNKTFLAMGCEPWSFDDIKNGRDGIHHSLRDSFPRIFGDKWKDARDIYFGSFKEIHLDKIKTLSGAEKTLEMLCYKGIYLAVVSNKTGECLREEVEYLGWSKYFTKIVGATDAEKDKPSPEPIYLALEGSGIDPSDDVWMIGDSKTDLDCAINAKCLPFFFGDGNFPAYNEVISIMHIMNHKELHDIIGEF